MPRKKRDASGFGERLRDIRQARGLTQVQLAEAIGSSQRAISHYETQPAYPPAPVLVDLARALRVSTDELLGVKAARLERGLLDEPEARRLWKQFLKLQELPEKDQRAVIRMINSLSRVGNGR